MAKVNYRATAGAMLAVFLILPYVARAQESPAKDSSRGFCARIDELTVKIDKRIGGNVGALQSRRGDQSKKLSQLWQTRDANRTEERGRRDDNRDAHYEKLLSRAENDAQKAAVVAFQKAVEAAVAARRTAHDEAVKAFRTGFESLIAKRRSSVDALVTAFKSEVRAVIEAAKRDCAQGKNSPEAREAMRTALKAAEAKYRGAVRPIADQFNAERRTLAAARKTAIDKAIADFRAAIEKARADLKTAFGEAK